MINYDLKYYQRIVVFLDVLGFKEKLYEFQKEAIDNHNEDKKPSFLISRKANDFVKVFKDVIGLMDKYDCNYYLFSDNICISIDPFSNKSLSVDILFTVSTLFKKFSDMGYFLRGAIDFGWMLDENDIALGVPLSEAYILESTKAVYPRILLSDSYVKLMERFDLDENDRFNYQNFFLTSCEINYINPFYNIIRNDDKIGFLNNYKLRIEEKLEETRQSENIYRKFEWLKNEYNNFLDLYVRDLEIFEQDTEFDEEFKSEIINIKIK